MKNYELIIKRTFNKKLYERIDEERHIVFNNVHLIEIHFIGKSSIAFINPLQEIKNKRRGWGKIKFWCNPILNLDKFHPKISLINYNKKDEKNTIIKITKSNNIYSFLNLIDNKLIDFIKYSMRYNEEERKSITKCIDSWIKWKINYIIENRLNLPWQNK